MIVVEAKNITPLDTLLTSGDGDCSYQVAVKVNGKTVWSGQVQHHDRMNGWGELLRLIAKRSETDRAQHPEGLKKPAGYKNLLDGTVQDEANANQ